MNRYYSEFKERKVTKTGPTPSPGLAKGSAPSITERSTRWPKLDGKGGPNRDTLNTKKIKVTVTGHMA